MESIDRYDSSYGVAFQAYARLRIRGAVFDGLRALREGTFQVYGADRVLIARERIDSFEHDASDDPLDTFVEMTIGLGLGFLLDTHSMPGPAQPPDAYAEIERAEMTATISDALDHLPERERAIMVLHYYHQLPFVEVARQLGVSKGRISQLHKRGLNQLRYRLRGRVDVEC